MNIVRTIGIDPGSRCTGYGIVEAEGNRLHHVSSGTINLPSSSAFPERLKIIYRQLLGVIESTSPDCMAIEDVFVARNAKSALRLGQARGVAMLAGVNADLPVFEYSALQIKKAVVGYGKADKDQVVQMIRFLFGLRESLNQNAADAIAVAVCHLNTRSSCDRWNIPEKL